MESVGKIAAEVAARSGGGGKRVRRKRLATAKRKTARNVSRGTLRGCHPRKVVRGRGRRSVPKARGGGRRASGGRVHKKPGGRGRRKTLAKRRVKKRKGVPKQPVHGIKDIFSI